MQTATNPQTGERLGLVGDEWKPIQQSATGPKGEKAYLVDGQWLHDELNLPISGSALEAGASLATGAVAAPVAGIAGLASTVIPGVKSGDVVRKVQDALTYEPRTSMGRAMVNAVGAPFQALASGADKAGAETAEATGSPAAGAAVNTAIQSLPMAAGVGLRVARPALQAVADSAAERAAALRSQNAAADAGISRASNAGYSTPPTNGILKMIESMAGEPRTQKARSMRNQPITNGLVRRDVGLPENSPITRDALAGIRREAGQAYEAVRGIGDITADAEYTKALKGIVSRNEGAEASFPTGKTDPIYKLAEELNRPSFTANAAVDKIGLLREQADHAFANRDRRMGRAYRDAANAIEDAIDRHLQGGATPDLLQQFRNARVQIAKTYAADKALNEATGNIDASVYARSLKAGRPLSGEGLTVAQAARQFPRSMQVQERVGGTGPTIFDVGLALAGKEALLLGARPLARAALAHHTPAPPAYSGNTLAAILARIEAENAANAGAVVGQGQVKR